MFKNILKIISLQDIPVFKENFRYLNSSSILAKKCTPDKVNVKICPPQEKELDKPCNLSECPHNIKKEEKKEEIKKETKTAAKEDDDEEIITEPLLSASYDDSKVVIIGAGAAGLAAAKFFEENNIKNYVILEALGRLGGRVQTEWFGDSIVELGATCPKGSGEYGTFLQTAIADGVLTGPITHTSIFSTCDGGVVNQSVAMIGYEIFKQIYCESIDMESGQLDYINFRMEHELANFPPQVKSDAARVMLGLLALIHKRGEKLQFINRQGSITYLQIPGGTVKVPLGYYGLLQPTIEAIPSEKIKLNKAVQNIRWGAVVCKDTPRALVKCCDGSVYPADYVLITVSLGVLKQSGDTLFCPALPAEKVEAMNILGYHHLNHIYFKFAEPIWSWSPQTISLKFKEKDLKDHEDWRKGIIRIKQVPGSNNVIWVTIAGQEAKYFEKIDGTTILNGVLDIIKDNMHILFVPSIECDVRSSWSNNVYFNGAYSCLPIGVGDDVQIKLSTPLPGNNAPVSPILFFAGEATCPKLHATFQGAKVSGIREASRIKRIIASSTEVSANREKIAMKG